MEAHALEINRTLRRVFVHVAECALRIPGALLLELWWIKHDLPIEKAEEMLQKSNLPAYLEAAKVIEFVQNRNLDQTAAHVLSVSGTRSNSGVNQPY